MTWAGRLASLSEVKSPYSDSSIRSDSPLCPPIGAIGPNGLGTFSEKSPANDAPIAVPCARCGTPSRPFFAIENADCWICDTCLPANPNDQAHDGEERAAIMAEGNQAAAVEHFMPVSWADPTILPTAGARCRNCGRGAWWCWTDPARPGWCCSTCHPAPQPGSVREVRT